MFVCGMWLIHALTPTAVKLNRGWRQIMDDKLYATVLFEFWIICNHLAIPWTHLCKLDAQH